MAKLQFYQPGHPPQYGRERWRRYEALRVEGFSKYEGRILSVHQFDDPVLRRMVSIRRNQVTRFSRMAEQKGWGRRTALYQFRKGLRQWYSNMGFVTKGSMVLQKGRYVRIGGGKPSPYEWFRSVEKRLAAQAGMSIDEYEKRRQEKETPISKKGMKGQVKAQRARARIRKQAYRHHDIVAEGGEPKKVPLSRLEKWLSDARKIPAAKGEAGRIQREWRASLRERIRSARDERDAGRPAMG